MAGNALKRPGVLIYGPLGKLVCSNKSRIRKVSHIAQDATTQPTTLADAVARIDLERLSPAHGAGVMGAFEHVVVTGRPGRGRQCLNAERQRTGGELGHVEVVQVLTLFGADHL